MRKAVRMGSSHYEYKHRNMVIWNEVAPRYHKRWASSEKGPFQITRKLIGMVGIRSGDTVLDVACGTGVVTREIRRKVRDRGRVVGADTSMTAIKIAKKWNGKRHNVDFVNADAERFCFSGKFDAVTCQYALFFFPDAQKALRNMRGYLKKSGTLGISVHGRKEKVPFFSSILDPVTRFIPDYVLPSSPDLDRFGTKSALRKEVSKAGFSKITVREFVFRYSPGRFEDYWRNYLRYVAKPLKEKLDGLEPVKRKELRSAVRKKTAEYTNEDGQIVFPWQVLVLTARSG